MHACMHTSTRQFVSLAPGQHTLPDKLQCLHRLISKATVLTPNLAEAAALTGMPAISSLGGMKEAARQLHAKGAGSVLVKGGHLEDEPDSGALDIQQSRGSWTESGTQCLCRITSCT